MALFWLLKGILDEEKASNQALHKLARAYCNDEALNAAGHGSGSKRKKTKSFKRAA